MCLFFLSCEAFILPLLSKHCSATPPTQSNDPLDYDQVPKVPSSTLSLWPMPPSFEFILQPTLWTSTRGALSSQIAEVS